jgi:hypothetical protein
MSPPRAARIIHSSLPEFRASVTRKVHVCPLPNAADTPPPALLERPEDGIAVVRLHRPEATNALSLELQALLSQMFAELGADPSVRCIVLTGGDKVFAAGATFTAWPASAPSRSTSATPSGCGRRSSTAPSR